MPSVRMAQVFGPPADTARNQPSGASSRVLAFSPQQVRGAVGADGARMAFTRRYVDEPAGGKPGLRYRDEAECPGEEGGHLASGDWGVGAVSSRAGGASGRDPGRGQGVDVGGVDMAQSVGETGGRSGLQIESPGEEGGHLTSGDGIVGAVAGRARGAPLGHAQVRQALHIRSPPEGVVDVGETGRRRRRGFVEGSDEPNGHHPAVDLPGRTYQVGAAFGAG